MSEVPLSGGTSAFESTALKQAGRRTPLPVKPDSHLVVLEIRLLLICRHLGCLADNRPSANTRSSPLLRCQARQAKAARTTRASGSTAPNPWTRCAAPPCKTSGSQRTRPRQAPPSDARSAPEECLELARLHHHPPPQIFLTRFSCRAAPRPGPPRSSSTDEEQSKLVALHLQPSLPPR